jgi:MFS family permease
MTASPRTGALWSGIALLALLLGLVLSTALVGFVESTFHVDHGFGLAGWPIVWGAAAIGGVHVGAHLVFTVGPTVRPRAFVVPGAGLLVAAAVQLALYGYAVARFGLIDPDQIGPVAALFGLLVALATAAFGVEIAPRRALVPPVVAAAVAAAVTLVVIGTHVPSMSDGIDAVAFPLAVALAAAALYVLAVVVRVARVLGGRSAARLQSRSSLAA